MHEKVSFTAQYAEALLRYFDGANREKPRDRRLWQYTKDMLNLTRKYPDDIEAAVLLAEALLAFIGPGELGYAMRAAEP